MVSIVIREIIGRRTAKTTSLDYVVLRNMDDILLGLCGQVVLLNLLSNLLVQNLVVQVMN